MLINENRWRAMRYGCDQGLIDLGRGAVIPYPQLCDELIDLIREDAAELGCEREVVHARQILVRGTSAHRQLAVHATALDDGADEQTALRKVVEHLVFETAKGLD
jgi:carboxylate-amine ligase